MVKFLFSAKIENAHKDFQKAIGAALCRYIPERGVLSIVSRREVSRKNSAILQGMHFRNLGRKVNILYKFLYNCQRICFICDYY